MENSPPICGYDILARMPVYVLSADQPYVIVAGHLVCLPGIWEALRAFMDAEPNSSPTATPSLN